MKISSIVFYNKNIQSTLLSLVLCFYFPSPLLANSPLASPEWLLLKFLNSVHRLFDFLNNWFLPNISAICASTWLSHHWQATAKYIVETEFLVKLLCNDLNCEKRYTINLNWIECLNWVCKVYQFTLIVTFSNLIWGHIYHFLANFHGRNTVISIRIHTLVKLVRGWKTSPHRFCNGFKFVTYLWILPCVEKKAALFKSEFCVKCSSYIT